MKAILKKALENTVITTFCFIVVTLLVATGCDKLENSDDGEANVITTIEAKVENSDDGEANVITKIEAKVENASKFSNVVAVKLMVFSLNINDYVEIARGDWKDDGFTIVLPETIETNYLQVSEYNRGLLEPIADPSSTMTISNKNVKAGTAHFWGIDKDGNEVTWFFPLKINDEGNADEAFCSYVDSDVTISGHDETEAVQGFEVNGIRYIALVKTSTNYSVILKKDWNLWWLSNVRNEQEFTINNKWSTAPINRLKWYSFEDKWELLD